MINPMKKYGPRTSTQWKTTCLDHLKHCSDPNCHVKQLMRMWNKLASDVLFEDYKFPEDKIQSSASLANQDSK